MRSDGRMVWWFNLLVLCVSSISPAQETPTISSDPLLDIIRTERWGHIVVKGTIVDEAGQPLDGVTVEVSYQPFEPLRLESGRHLEEIVNGAFTYDFAQTDTVNLFAYKSSEYHYVRSGFIYSKPAAGVRIEDGVQYYDLRLVMDRVMARTPKREYHIRLPAGTVGPWRVWDIAGSRTGPDDEQRIVNVNTLSEIGGPIVYARQTSDGMLELVVEHDQPGSGFVSVRSEDIQGPDIVDGMRVAPMEGYQERIRFGPRLQEYKGNFVPFYFKLNGRYGKGFVDSVWAIEDGLIPVGVAIYLQTDGTRYVDWPE